VDVIAEDWDLHVRTKLRLSVCGVKEGYAEETQFGAKGTGMVRSRLPNPLCCSAEMHGENKRTSKFRVKLWRRSWGRESV